MPKYRNVSGAKLVVGAVRLAPGQAIVISERDAAKFGSSLQPADAPSQQVLTEAPVGEAKPVVTEKKATKSKAKKTSVKDKIKKKLKLKVDIDGDGVPDVEVEGDIVGAE